MSKLYYHEWTKEDDLLLMEIINASNDRKKTFEKIKEAAERLNRTTNACHNRYYRLSKEQNGEG